MKEYKILAGLRSNVEEKLNTYAKKGWVPAGNLTAVLEPGDVPWYSILISKSKDIAL